MKKLNLAAAGVLASLTMNSAAAAETDYDCGPASSADMESLSQSFKDSVLQCLEGNDVRVHSCKIETPEQFVAGLSHLVSGMKSKESKLFQREFTRVNCGDTFSTKPKHLSKISKQDS